jgi:hypothetical protein
MARPNQAGGAVNSSSPEPLSKKIEMEFTGKILILSGFIGLDFAAFTLRALVLGNHQDSSSTSTIEE